jgi:hypothetical protein
VGDSGYAFLSVKVLDSAAAADEWGTPPRPRTLRTPRDTTVLHALTAESVTVHREDVDGWHVEVETAIVTGGPGFSRQPFLRAVWPLPGGRWASAPRELDTQQAMLRTVHLARGAGLW